MLNTSPNPKAHTTGERSEQPSRTRNSPVSRNTFVRSRTRGEALFNQRLPICTRSRHRGPHRQAVVFRTTSGKEDRVVIWPLDWPTCAMSSRSFRSMISARPPRIPNEDWTKAITATVVTPTGRGTGARVIERLPAIGTQTFGPSERTRPLQALPGGLVVDSPKALVAASSVSRRSMKRRSAPSFVSSIDRRKASPASSVRPRRRRSSALVECR